jgi:hypothetical protein
MLNRLPTSPVDGQIAIDSTGTRYKYYAEFNEWISIGNTVSSQLVNYQQDGMATPDAVGQIEDLRDAAIVDFKLLDNEDAYYYMLQSSTGRLFLFTVEGQDARIELNRNALSNLFLSNACQGTEGTQGIAGITGDDGLAGPNESIYTPQVDGSELSIAVEFETPLDTEVSFRLFNGDKFVEIWYDASASETSVVKQSTEVILSHVLNVDDGLFTAVVITDGDWGDGWTAKVRQRGPDGRDGVDGNPFIEIVDTNLYALKATEFIASARSTTDGSIFYISQPAGDLPTAHIRPHNFTQASCEVMSLVSNDGIEVEAAIIGAVEPSIDSNKLIRRWVFEPTTTTFSDPDLPVWIPDPSCATRIEFSWWEQFEDTGDECQVKFTEADALPERCCQEDFFFCPNIGPCPVLSGGPFQGQDSSYTPPTPSHASRPSLSSTSSASSSSSSTTPESSSSLSSTTAESSSSSSSTTPESSSSSSSATTAESSSSSSSTLASSSSLSSHTGA